MAGKQVMAFISIGSLLLVVCLSPAWAHHEAQHVPAGLRNVGLDQRLNAQIPLDLQFRDASGTAVQLRQYVGKKPVILTLVYYDCPNLCPTILNGLLRTLRALTLSVGKQFDIVTVSIDSDNTPALAAAKKARYLRDYGRPGAADGWHFLTGNQQAIERLARAVGFRYAYDVDKDQFAHASGIMILTPQGKLARYFYGIEYAPRDVRLGLVEAADNTIGSPVDQLLLFCYHYDPQSGTYSLAILNAIRGAGAATVLALGAFMGLMLRRDRRQQARTEKQG